jgi:hypothetical protein
MQRLITMPAAFPMIRSNSLLARSRKIRDPERTGAYMAPICHMRKEARTKLVAIRKVQNAREYVQGSKARGATIKLVGKYMCCVISRYSRRREPDPRSPPSARKTR